MTKTISNKLLGGASKAVLLAAAIGAAGAIVTAMPQPAHASASGVELLFRTGSSAASTNGTYTTPANLVGLPKATASTTLLCGTNAGIGCSTTGTADSGALTFHTASITTNLPGKASESYETAEILKFTNNSTRAITFNILAGGFGFNTPTAPPASYLVLSDTFSGTSVSANTFAAGSTLSTFSCTNPANTANHTAACSADATAKLMENALTGVHNFSAANSANIGSLGSPYAIDQWVFVTIEPGQVLKFENTATVTPVPEPASLTLFGSALVGLGAMRRRRRAKRQAQQA